MEIGLEGNYRDTGYHKLAKARSGRKIGKSKWAILDKGTRLARVVIGCPRCGGLATLAFLNDLKLMGKGHHITRDGYVTPCIHCGRGRKCCVYDAKLIGWPYREVGEAQIAFAKSREW